MSRTVGEAGRHVSRYNLIARLPDSNKIAVANLFRGACGMYAPIEMLPPFSGGCCDRLKAAAENHGLK